MVLERHISDLLYRYNCVVVPGFGAFLSQLKSAEINPETHSFHPPSKNLSFNAQLTSNDGLLVAHLAEVEKMSYEAMMELVDEKVDAWKNALNEGKSLSFINIGQLKQNREGKIQFQPSNQVNYLTSSFGMSSFVSSPVVREVLKKEVVEIEEKVPFIITPEKRENLNIRPYLKYAAIFLLALSAGLTGYRSYNESINQKQVIVEKALEEVSKDIQEATFFDTAPLELPTLTLDAITNKPKQGIHNIIAGVFRFKENAEKKIGQLKQIGYDEAAYFGTNDHGLHMVTYGSHSDANKALQALKQIRREHSNDAWMISNR